MEQWREAFRATVERVRARYDLALSDAEDVAMDALALVLRKYGAESLGDRALLVAVAEYEALRFSRERSREILPDDFPSLPDPRPFDPVSAQELLRETCFSAGIAKEDDVRLLQLALLEDRSFRELADWFGVSEEALRQRVSRLRKRLRDHLRGSGG
jgi:DNA-directed RNA polymerase specialized sigma24 family protein